MREKLFDALIFEVNELELRITIDGDRHYDVFELRTLESYDGLKQYLVNVWNSYENKTDALDAVLDTIESEYISDYVTDNYHVESDPPPREDVDAMLDEAYDKVWVTDIYDIRRGVIKDMFELAEIERIHNKYTDIPKEGYNNWERGYWNGILDTLHWLIGGGDKPDRG